LLKFQIMSKGVKIDEKVRALIGKEIKDAVNMRSGLSSGLDMILPDNIWVNAPINEWFVNQSKLELRQNENSIVLTEGTQLITEVKLLPRPAYYDRYTSDGIPMKAIGSTRGDRLSISITNSCVFWKDIHQRCKFCAIGHNEGGEVRTKKVDHVLETVDAALHDPVLPIRHVYLNSGSMVGSDRGMRLFSRIIGAIKSNFTVHVHLNPCPPENETYMDELYESGLDEISFNVELTDEHIANEIIPGKFRLIGLNHYYRMLSYAVKLFGDRKVSSCLIVGLEDPTATLEGVEHLSQLGVISKLSCFRPVKGALLCDREPPSVELMGFVYLRAREIAKTYGLPLGPLCIPCQLHSVVAPDTKSGHYFL